jgi:hypothetical protein
MRCHAAFLGLTLAITATAMNEAPGQELQPQKKVEATEMPQPKSEVVVQLLKTQLQAAQKCHQAAVDTFQVERAQGFLVLKSNHPARPDQVHTWSARWLNAQRDLSETKDERIAALVAHQQRMKDLQANIKMLVEANPGLNGGNLLPFSELSAAQWYLAEAELWLLKERGK